MPLLLTLFNFLIGNLKLWMIQVIYAGIDVLIAVILSRVAVNFTEQLLTQQKLRMKTYSKDAMKLTLKSEDLTNIPTYIFSAYMFNPFTIMNCLGMTITVLDNLLLACSFLSTTKKNKTFTGFFLGLLTCQSIYNVMFVIPAVMYISNVHSTKKPFPWNEMLNAFSIYIMMVFLQILLSHHLAGSWHFIKATYGFTLAVPNLKPNIGLYWYFFTEMFDHFHLFFIYIFQINIFVYLVPLVIRFQSEPMLIKHVLSFLIVIFKPYPCIGDLGFCLALLPLWSHLYKYMRQVFLVCCFFIVTSTLGPLLYNLWKYEGSANANFYFAITLAFATAQIFLVSDILFAYIRRQYYMHHKINAQLENKEAALVLK